MDFPPPLPERSKRLHNFTLPYLRWGHQRSLRCVKLPSSSSSSPSPDQPARRSPEDGKLRLDLVKPPKVSTFGNGGGDDAARPWNLRTRRAACNEPGDETTTESRHDGIGVKRGDGDAVSDKKEKVRFSVSLLREEIEEDFTALFGKKPPRRPKKRPRLVQKQINTLFPGFWLAEEVTEGSYDVPEPVET